MWEELGISGGTAIIVCIAFYFIIKCAVKAAMEDVKEVLENIVYEKNNDNGLISEVLKDNIGTRCKFTIKDSCEELSSKYGLYIIADLVEVDSRWFGIKIYEDRLKKKHDEKVIIRIRDISFIEKVSTD